MKTAVVSFCILFFGVVCFGQEVEFCSSVNTSTEKRFQNAYGIGLQYQHDLGKKYKAGLGVHYNFNNVGFDDIPYIDANPDLLVTEKIHSDSKRFSIRLNLQGLLKNNEHVSLSLGPELSYNYTWGNDQIDKRIGQVSNVLSFKQKNNLTKELGFGLISKIEIKNIIIPQLSLCYTIRPEILTDGKFPKGDKPVFSGVLGFTEFQIGLKYSFKK